VADYAVFFEEIIKEEFDFHFSDVFDVDGDLRGALRAVAAGHFGGNAATIGDNVIDDALANVFVNGAKMLAEWVVGGFAGLGHEIGDVDAGRFGARDGVGNFRDE
jgi:hypothetical protein